MVLPFSLDDSNYNKAEVKYALIIDGMSLAIALHNYVDDLRFVCRNVVTVLCCRMSPLQKAQVIYYLSDLFEDKHCLMPLLVIFRMVSYLVLCVLL